MSECDLLCKRRSCEQRVVRAPVFAASPLADSHIISQLLTGFRAEERLLAVYWRCGFVASVRDRPGASSLSTTLPANSSLTNLDLSYNIIGDAGASYSLSTALSEDSSVLKYLKLRGNSIDAGASSLSTTLTANSSPTNLDFRNTEHYRWRWCSFFKRGLLGKRNSECTLIKWRIYF